jgi:hypothetical protein
MDQMIFHIRFDEGASQVFFVMATAGTVFGASLGSVSPVGDIIQERGVTGDLAADGGGFSAQSGSDRADRQALYQANSDLLPFVKREMDIAFFLNCDRLDHNGNTPC